MGAQELVGKANELAVAVAERNRLRAALRDAESELQKGHNMAEVNCLFNDVLGRGFQELVNDMICSYATCRRVVYVHSYNSRANRCWILSVGMRCWVKPYPSQRVRCPFFWLVRFLCAGITARNGGAVGGSESAESP